MFGSVGIPHGFCFLWNPGLLWLHVVSDSLIALAYFLIPFALIRIVRKRRDIPFDWMLLCFGAFIVACGLTHVLEVVTLWHPFYWLSGSLKAVTAIISLVTFFLLLRLTPAILQIPRMGELRELNEKLSSVLENTAVCVYAVDRDWRITYMNGKAKRQLRVDDGVLGRYLWETFPESARTTRTAIERVMASGRPEEFESYYEPLDLSTTVNANAGSDGGVTVFFNDISDRRRLERELEREKVLKNQRIQGLAQMAGGIAHEISNPLGIIHARASDLAEQAEAGTPLEANVVAAACSSIVRTSDRAIRILKGLRLFAREGSLDPMHATELRALIGDTVELVRSKFDLHSILLEVKIAEDVPVILCREVQIAQIVLNLLNNAFDAIESVGSSECWVRLTAAVVAEDLVIEVVDSGPGVAEENKPLLMQPFFTTKQMGAGMGIGLSISRTIAEDHGGTLSLTERDGHTCFRLTLPQMRQGGAR